MRPNRYVITHGSKRFTRKAFTPIEVREDILERRRATEVSNQELKTREVERRGKKSDTPSEDVQTLVDRKSLVVPHHRECLDLINTTHPLPSVVSSKLQELEGDHFEASSTLDIIKTECVPRPSQQEQNELEGT